MSLKVICERAPLLDAVNLVASVVPSRAQSPVQQCVRISTLDGVLVLASTDLEIGLRLGLDRVDVQEEGSILISADKLAQIVRNSDDATLTIESTDAPERVTHIRGADAHFKIYGYDPADAPPVRGLEEFQADFEADAQQLRRLMQRTIFAAATENSRYAINGVLVDREADKLRFISTDGRRLAVATGHCSGEGNDRAIVPIKALNLLMKIDVEPETPVRVQMGESQATFAIGDGPTTTVLTTNLVEGTFPPFEDVIPKEHDKRATFEVDVLRSAIRRAALLTNEESNGVRLSFEDKTLTLTSRAPEMGEAEIQVHADAYEGEPLIIGFNPSYITDALKIIDTADVIVEFKAPNKPGVLRTGNDFTYVVMPVSL